jgi:AcrR family transcriptional regulator
MAKYAMKRKERNNGSSSEGLSRESIIEAAVALLDSNGESALTFRALSERLSTGSGAIYWHIANKSDLLSAACDAVVARTIAAIGHGPTPKESIRTFSLAMFDAIEARPWMGAALPRAAGEMPIVRILECLGGHVRALGLSEQQQWLVASAMLNYILGVAGQNAANMHVAMSKQIDRHDFLHAVASTWSRLDADAYPFVRRAAEFLPQHNDREDFLAGIDLILRGLDAG